MLEKVLDIISDKLSVEDIKLTDTFRSLNYDEFDYIEIIMDLEKEFAIALPEEYVTQPDGCDLEKVGDLYKILFTYMLPFSDDGNKYLEISERLIEFEVFNSNYEIDLISLNSVFDFYGYEFDRTEYE